MAADKTYLKWPNAKGDVAEAQWKEWLDVSIAMQGAANCPAFMSIGKGAESRATGTPRYPPIRFTMKRSPATVALLKSLFKGIAALDVEVHFVGANKKVNRTIKLRSARITNIEGLLGDQQTVTLLYSAICFQDNIVGADGKVTDSPKYGINLLTGKEMVW